MELTQDPKGPGVHLINSTMMLAQSKYLVFSLTGSSFVLIVLTEKKKPQANPKMRNTNCGLPTFARLRRAAAQQELCH